MKPTNNNENEQFDIKKVKVPRTKESTIMEVIAVLLLIAAWTVSLAKHQFSGADGQNWLVCIIALTIASILLLAVCYRPKFFNYSRELRNMRQVMIMVRSSRVMAIEFALTVLGCPISGELMNNNSTWMWICVIAITITALIFVYKAK